METTKETTRETSKAAEAATEFVASTQLVTARAAARRAGWAGTLGGFLAKVRATAPAALCSVEGFAHIDLTKMAGRVEPLTLDRVVIVELS